MLLCHGFPVAMNDARHSASTFPELIDRVANELGWAAMTFTFRGCGDSEGDFSMQGWIDDLRAAMDVDKFVAVCSDKPAIHRFPRSMATRIHQLCVALTEDHNGKGENVWRDVEDAKELMVRLRKLPGYGQEKAEIFIALLGKRFGVRPKDWKKYAGVFSDARPRSVADIYSATTLLKVRGFKQMQRARDTDKQDRPLVRKKSRVKK